MEISIIGTGPMAAGTAARLVAGGHSVELLGRRPEATEQLADELRATDGAAAVSTAPLGSVPGGTVILLAIPYDAIDEVLAPLDGQLAGRVLVDMSNPVDWNTMDGLVVPAGSSAAEQIQASEAAAGATVVKAFNTVFAANLKDGEGGGQVLDVLIAGDDGTAKTTLSELVTDAGMRPVDVGPLRRARELEAIQLLHITMQRSLAKPWSSAIRLLCS